MTPEVRKMLERRAFIRSLAVGATVVSIGGVSYVVAGCSDAGVRPDGQKRLPPGQRRLIEKPDGTTEAAVVEPAKPKLIRYDATPTDRPRVPPKQETRDELKPMGGQPGEPSVSAWRLRVHGLVENELTLSMEDLLAYTLIEQTCDVHCVTGWSVLGAIFNGVRVSDIAAAAGVSGRARHVIFEAAHGYTANVDVAEALKPNSIIVWDYNGQPLARGHGAPVRNILPDRYFWKSAKWLTGLRFVEKDERGFWEQRGYHNHADPWLEERYSSDED
jgi:DMSO/TMAO reductase YedYZ molybdopterin-dependent catalytic subunit